MIDRDLERWREEGRQVARRRYEADELDVRGLEAELEAIESGARDDGYGMRTMHDGPPLLLEDSLWFRRLMAVDLLTFFLTIVVLCISNGEGQPWSTLFVVFVAPTVLTLIAAVLVGVAVCVWALWSDDG